MGKYLSCCSMGNTIGAYTRYIINSVIFAVKTSCTYLVRMLKIILIKNTKLSKKRLQQQFD